MKIKKSHANFTKIDYYIENHKRAIKMRENMIASFDPDTQKNLILEQELLIQSWKGTLFMLNDIRDHM